ncbi:hypothetical protein AQJ27_04185 [Streptomyces olivochromogenes]|uniref:UvrABC system protein A n=1 Tax=Streptomyces olivochromogenes TaxID=1963 RepID=A0A250V3W0_STROL|nr:hypothetical protein AQJ27_04185 [Streptomyces olivochromogenes]GAX48877.1 UvrABC system protein A [Streptomyces olivochromogenes]
MKDRLVIKGARRHNLRDISVELPRNALIVFTGVSGSDKSSLRLLYARVGRPNCPECGEPVERQPPQQIVDRLLAQGDGVRVQVPAPVVRDRKGEHADVFGQLRTDGFSRCGSTGRSIRSPGRRRWTGAGSTRPTWSWTGSR